METFRKGDIVLFSFPFTDLSDRKIRPCLVLSDEMSLDILLCQITSKSMAADKFTVELNANETLEGTIHTDSYIRANMLFTCDKYQIAKKVCVISDPKYSEVINKIILLISK